MPIRLNIGAGDTNLPGFTPIDIKNGKDARALDYPDGSVGEVYASHVLEHIHHSQTWNTVREWCRVLEPGGRIRIAVPDFAMVESDYKAGKITHETYQAFLYGSWDEPTDRHLAQPSFERLKQMLEFAGCESVGHFSPEFPDCTVRCPYSLNVEAFKRQIIVPRQPKVVLMLSRPRLGFSDFYDGGGIPGTGAAEVCRELGWRLVVRGGTEWAKGMELGIGDILSQLAPDYIMALDNDSLFGVEDCRRLLAFMQSRPDVGAVWPVEPHRHLDTILGWADGFEQNYDFSGEFTQMGSGHFGCTLIRRQVFESIERPWFQSVPSEETGWKGGVDADVAVWVAANAKGWKFGQLNTVQIQHGELCYKHVGEKGIEWHPIQRLVKRGRPTSRFDGRMLQQRAADKKLNDGLVLVRIQTGIGGPCTDRDGCIREWVKREVAEEHRLEIILPAPESRPVPPEGSPELMPARSLLADDGA